MNLTESKSSSHVNLLAKQFDRQSSTVTSSTSTSQIKKSQSTSSVVISKRGFKPSDRYDPHKREFLTTLSQKLWHVSLDESTQRDSKPIDLEKLFTPASDSGEATPSRNRKMYASSSFYSPIHPTVEDQVELARRISSSLSDISNKQSKGQSMYVNRMKRSVKWVHGGDDKNESQANGVNSTIDDPSLPTFKIPNIGPKEMKLNPPSTKSPLKLVMNPHGQLQDINSLVKQGLNVQTPLSPELCFDLVRDLNTTKGKGAELFAKRRKKSEKWVVDENTVKQSSSLSTTTTTTNIHQQVTQVSASEKTYIQSNQQREQQLQKLNEIKERFSQPRVKLIKSPWEAALETGSVDTAFVETGPIFPDPKNISSWTPKLNETLPAVQTSQQKTDFSKLQGASKSDLYKPNIPRGWSSSQSQQLTYGSTSPLPPASSQVYSQPEPAALSTPYASRITPTSLPGPARYLDYKSMNNYNTAPRGWKQNLDYYRPVTFTPSSKLPEGIHYTDY